MRVLLHGRHRYPARRGEGSGLEPRSRPSDALDHLLDLLARGLAEKGHEVNYLLPAGADGPLPEGVRRASSPDRAGRRRLQPRDPGWVPWVVTARRARGGRLLRPLRARIVPPPTPEAPRPSPQRDLRLTLARPLAGRVAIRAQRHRPRRVRLQRDEGGLPPAHGRDAGRPCPTCTGPRAWRTPSAPPGRPGSSSWSPGRRASARSASDPRAARRRRRPLPRGHPRRAAELLAGARALLFPTRINEGFGLVMAEALMSGTPVIVSDSGALAQELIDPDVGFVQPTRTRSEPRSRTWTRSHRRSAGRRRCATTTTAAWRPATSASTSANSSGSRRRLSLGRAANGVPRPRPPGRRRSPSGSAAG